MAIEPLKYLQYSLARGSESPSAGFHQRDWRLRYRYDQKLMRDAIRGNQRRSEAISAPAVRPDVYEGAAADTARLVGELDLHDVIARRDDHAHGR